MDALRLCFHPVGPAFEREFESDAEVRACRVKSSRMLHSRDRFCICHRAAASKKVTEPPEESQQARPQTAADRRPLSICA